MIKNASQGWRGSGETSASLVNSGLMTSCIERLKFAIIYKWSNETMAFWQTKQQDGAKRPQCGATRGASVGLWCRTGGSWAGLSIQLQKRRGSRP